MDEIIDKIKIEDFQYFEFHTEEEGDEIKYLAILIYRHDDESKIKIFKHYTSSLGSAFSEKDMNLFRVVCINRVIDRSDKYNLKRMHEVTTQDEYKTYYDNLKKNEENRKKYEIILKKYLYEKLYNLEKNEWKD